MVSVFATRRRLVLGQVEVADKSNEIVAIPKLLELLAIEGAIVTIDAIGCQREIARQILAKKADYVLALKGSQGTSSIRNRVMIVVRTWRAARETVGDISEAEVREALERLDPLWNELFPAEQARIYHLGHVVMRRN
jgi:hypothetical protein